MGESLISNLVSWSLEILPCWGKFDSLTCNLCLISLYPTPNLKHTHMYICMCVYIYSNIWLVIKFDYNA